MNRIYVLIRFINYYIFVKKAIYFNLKKKNFVHPQMSCVYGAYGTTDGVGNLREDYTVSYIILSV